MSARELQIRQQLDQFNQEQETLKVQVEDLKQKGSQPSTQTLQRQNEIASQIRVLMAQLDRLRTPDNVPPSPTPGPRGTPSAIGVPTLRNVLDELAKRWGVRIIPDATVKADPVNTDVSVAVNQPNVSAALQMIVSSTPEPYAFRPLDERTFEVFRPISNTYSGSKLDIALRDISTLAGVPIVVDPNLANMAGDVNVSFENVPLEKALELLLAGKPLVFKKTPDYYLVAGRGIQSPTFVDISETRRVRLNYTQPSRVKSLLSPIFLPYVQAELPNNRDPNDQGNMLLVTAAPAIADRIVEDIKLIDRYKRHVLLEARVVSMEKGNLLNLGAEWSWPTIQAGLFTSHGITNIGGTNSSGWPYGVQIGYAPDQTFTNALMMALNLLEQNSQADIIANPTVVAQDGSRAEMRVIQEQWFMMTSQQAVSSFYTQAQLQKIESGTVLTITPNIGDNNDITLRMAVEVSDSIPKARGSDLPLVTRRTAKNAVTVKDGGTVAVAGLTENRSRSDEKRVPFFSSIPLVGELFKSKNNDKASREVAVFVTAHLVAEGTQGSNRLAEPAPVATGPEAAPEDIRRQIEMALQRNQ